MEIEPPSSPYSSNDNREDYPPGMAGDMNGHRLLTTSFLITKAIYLRSEQGLQESRLVLFIVYRKVQAIR